MTLGKIRLDNGDEVTGLHCDPAIVTAGEDITAHGDWRTYRRLGGFTAAHDFTEDVSLDGSSRSTPDSGEPNVLHWQ
jgi:hypothetical protein